MKLIPRLYFSLAVSAAVLLIKTDTYAQHQAAFKENFNTPVKLETIGRGLVKTDGGVLKTRDAYAVFGDSTMADYEVNFRARTPVNEKEVQIWSGFRASSRNDRYILGLRGGIQNDLYLARLGYMGTDDHLALRHLDFRLTPGKWYDIKIQVAANRIKVFLNQEQLPRIDVTDPYTAFSAKGKVTLGGSWITTDFDDLRIEPLKSKIFSNQPVREYAVQQVDKVKKRTAQRAGYKPLKVQSLSGSRTKISLNRDWLFSPGYETKSTAEGISPSVSDQNWHVMTVPQFWNPNREWLHGEKYNTASKGVSDNFYQKEIERCEGYTFDYKKTDVGYYRQWIELPADIKDKYLELNFDAVSKIGEVHVNGQRAGVPHIGMFGEFKVNVTPFLKPGKNLIVVKVSRDYVKDIKDADVVTDVAVTVPVTNKMLKDLAHGFYNDDPAGIWQPVSLVVSNPVRITDVFIKPSLTGADFEVTVKNNTAQHRDFSVATAIAENGSAKKLYSGTGLKNLQLNPGEEKTFNFSVSALKPLLWTPATPYLYNFSFTLNDSAKEIDRETILSGFRTFVAKGDFFYLNDVQYWLRGGNQTPMSLAPTDSVLADKYNQLMRNGNQAITRTHTAPYNELWLNSSDRIGVGVSYEGGWPWLMIASSMPDSKLIELWRNEYFDLVKKYRNHPSLLFWTINNEMKFYDNDPDFEQVKVKMKIISDVVKQVRNIDPTRPVSFDSNYMRNEKKFGKDYFNTIDDGDIDDHHWYINWYHGSVFSEFNGEWQQKFKNPGRPLISQEFSTGYPSETGHPVRFYTYVHQNPGTLIGNYAYEYANPAYFLTSQSFISRESAEAIRRTNEKAAGILHFSAITWFKNVYEADKIAPHITYLQMKKALQPVLVSAEIWGRHFYAGTKLPVRIYVVNDRENGTALAPTELQWSLQTETGKVLSSGTESIPAVAYYGRKFISPEISIPANLPAVKLNGKLVLKLTENGKTISENDYDLLFAEHKWLASAQLKNKKLLLVDLTKNISPVVDELGLRYIKAARLKDAWTQNADILILSGLDSVNTSAADIQQIKSFVAKGGKLLLLNAGQLAVSIFPAQIRGLIKEKGEIMTMEIPESIVFNDIEPLETRYFNNNKRESPAVISAAYRVNRQAGTEALATFSKVHGYLEGDIYERTKKLDEIKGFPVVKISGKGTAILSEVLLTKGNTDPVAGKLFMNMLEELTGN